jgi:UDP-N-acetylmuramate dehydrogenase
MIVSRNVSLRKYNTFGIDSKADFFVELSDVSQFNELHSLLNNEERAILLLGGGSNLLFTSNKFHGLVVKNNLQGKSIIKRSSDHVFVKAMAGENWADFVSYCVINDWGGLENLTQIPGNVGTSPMQNIGAYGVELKDSFYCLDALEISTGQIHKFFYDDCKFGYRDSYFKQSGKGQFIIISVTFKLTSRNHLIQTGYGSVKDELGLQGIREPGIQDVMFVINSIRKKKLPDPDQLGNAGSFFKNPVIEKEHCQRLLIQWPKLPVYPVKMGFVKTAAGWLIEQAGWKGYRDGDAGVHENQALVLVNFGNAQGTQIVELAKKIQNSVFEKFGIELEPEVNFV